MPAQPSVSDVRPVDPVLTNLSIAFKNDRFLHEELAPFSRVEQKSGTFFVYTRDFWMRRMNGAVRGEGNRYLRVGHGVSTDTYETVERGFEKALDDPTKAASLTPESLETVDLQYLTNIMQLDLEKRAAAALFITGVWGTSTTLAGGNQWSDYANSDPIANADTARNTIKRNTGAVPNKLFMGVSAWQKLREHPLVLDKYKYTQIGVITPELVAPVMQVESITVGDSVENTAAEGATYVGADIWTDNALFVVKGNPGLGVLSGAFNLIWPEAGAYPWAVQQYRDEPVRSDVQRIFNHNVYKVVAAQAGYIYLDAIA